jgi:hypothetical protein
VNIPKIEVQNASFIPSKSVGTLLSISFTLNELNPWAIPQNVPKSPIVVSKPEKLSAVSDALEGLLIIFTRAKIKNISIPEVKIFAVSVPKSPLIINNDMKPILS